MKALQDELKFRTEIDNFFKTTFPTHAEAVAKDSVPNPTDFDCLDRKSVV